MVRRPSRQLEERSMPASGDLMLRGVRVVGGRGVRAERADVRIVGGRIASIDAASGAPPSAEAPAPGDGPPSGDVLALDGRTVTPGLMNAHAHVCLDGGPDPDRTIREETQTE